MKLDKALIENVEMDDINLHDWPDLCDAFISSADYDGLPMTNEQLDEINQDNDFVYEHAREWCF
jgi:hypothetical protein